MPFGTLRVHFRSGSPGLTTTLSVEDGKIAGMRDGLIHVYHRVDPEIVWNVVETESPELLRLIRRSQDRDRPQPDP